MKNLKYLIIMLILFIMLPANIYASEVFSVGDFVYYDPTSTNTCDYTNYWTPYNQESTCYRFVVLTTNDTSSNSTLKIMLDHDVGYGTFDNYKTILENGTKNWSRYNGEIDIIDEDTIYDTMKLNEKPTLDNVSVNGGVSLGFLMTNTMYISNKVKHSNYGYWSKNIYEEDNNYVYTVTEYANNRLVERNYSRGIRPVIIIEKSFLKKTPNITNIDYLIKNGLEYKFKQENQIDNNYKHLQGFTFAKDKLVLHLMHIGDANKGVLLVYGGHNYQTLHKYDYGNTAHGNDMTYNSNTNKVLLLVNGDIYEYNGDTINYEKKYTTNEYGAIGYDNKWNHYFAYSNQRIYLLNDNLEKLHSFDFVTLGVRQGIEYHNGYIYASTSEHKCPNTYQIYCLEEEWSSITYVYNVKLNADGTPTKDFGRLVDRLYIGPGIGELESISFQNEQMYFGYATRKNDNTYLYKFYSFPYEKIMYHPKYTINYKEETNKKIITISSNEELKNIEGWTISSDLKTLTKEVVENTASTNVNICDLYNNCKKETIKELVFEEKPPLEGEDDIITDIESEEPKDETQEIPEDSKIPENPDTGQKIYVIILILTTVVYIIYRYQKQISEKNSI